MSKRRQKFAALQPFEKHYYAMASAVSRMEQSELQLHLRAKLRRGKRAKR